MVRNVNSGCLPGNALFPQGVGAIAPGVREGPQDSQKINTMKRPGYVKRLKPNGRYIWTREYATGECGSRLFRGDCENCGHYTHHSVDYCPRNLISPVSRDRRIPCDCGDCACENCELYNGWIEAIERFLCVYRSGDTYWMQDACQDAAEKSMRK